MPRKERFNWAAIKEEYVNADSDEERPTLEQLATKYGCSFAYMREKASADNWRLQAQRYMDAIATERHAQRSKVVATSLAEWDIKCLNAAKAGLHQIHARLQKAVENTDKGQEPLSFNQVNQMSTALQRIHAVGRMALGEESSLNIKIDYKKLTDEQLQRIARGEDPRNVLS